MLAADLALLGALGAEVGRADEALAEVLAATPAGVLTSVPGVGVVSASADGAALGEPSRFGNADGAYRFAGLSPTAYESAGRARGSQHISREGSVELRQAILDLGRGMGRHEPDFAAYRRRLLSRGKPPLVAATALGHRAHRLAFALVRSQRPYDAERWAASVAKGRSAMATTPEEAHQDDVTCPPPATTVAGASAHDNPLVGG